MSVNHTCPTAFPNATLEEHIWHHLCLTVTPDILTLHYQTLTYTMKVSEMSLCPMQFEETDSALLFLGYDEFSGHISHMKIYERELTKEEVQDMVECRPGPADFLSYSNVTLFGKVSQVTSDLEMCKPPPNEFLALFKLCGNYKEAQDFCVSNNGRLINERDDYNVMVSQILRSRDNSDSSIEVWINNRISNTKAEVLSITRDGTGTTGMYYRPTYYTTSVLSVMACMLPTNNTVYIKDDNITLMVMQQYNNMLLLQSEQKEFIFRKHCQEILEEPLDGKDFIECLVYINKARLAKFTGIEKNRALIGRHKWWFQIEENERKMTISMCGMNSFTCDDGQCIPLENRCDGLSHCTDHSDEGAVCKIMNTLPSSYWKTSCPEQKPQVDLRVTVTGINAVSLETNSFKVSLIITISWYDERLTFLNLQNSTKTLDMEDYRKIWVPPCTYLNADYADNLNLQSKTKTSVLEQYSVKATTDGSATVQDSYEGKHFSCQVLK